MFAWEKLEAHRQEKRKERSVQRTSVRSVQWMPFVNPTTHIFILSRLFSQGTSKFLRHCDEKWVALSSCRECAVYMPGLVILHNMNQLDALVRTGRALRRASFIPWTSYLGRSVQYDPRDSECPTDAKRDFYNCYEGEDEMENSN